MGKGISVKKKEETKGEQKEQEGKKTVIECTEKYKREKREKGKKGAMTKKKEKKVQGVGCEEGVCPGGGE